MYVKCSLAVQFVGAVGVSSTTGSRNICQNLSALQDRTGIHKLTILQPSVLAAGNGSTDTALRLDNIQAPYLANHKYSITYYKRYTSNY